MSDSLQKSAAIVTGASSGIGSAIAAGLANQGAAVWLVGRRTQALEAVRKSLPEHSRSAAQVFTCDLSDDTEIIRLRDAITSHHTRVDVLIHSAGAICFGPLETTASKDFDQQFRINVRAPFLLTQAILPLIKSARGQVVFINSSVGLRAKEHVGAYAASKHALRAIADTLRMEVNTYGVRVLSVFPGNTATPMQEAVQDYSGRHFDNAFLLQPDDIASTVLNALTLPRTAEVTDIHIRPFRKPPP